MLNTYMKMSGNNLFVQYAEFIVIINSNINLKDHRLNSGIDSWPIIGSDFGANITSQYRPAIIIQAAIDHRFNIDSHHWLSTLRAWADHRPAHIFLHGRFAFKSRALL